MSNALDFFRCLANRWLDRDYAWAEPQTLPRTAIYHPQKSPAELKDWQADWQADQPVAAVLFYRSHLQAANTGFIDVFCQRLQAAGLNPLPIAVASLKEPGCLTVVEDLAGRSRSRRDSQHHRFRSIQPRSAALATVSPQHSGDPGDLRPGQRTRLARQRTGPRSA